MPYLLVSLLWCGYLLINLIQTNARDWARDFIEWYTAAYQLRHGQLYDAAHFDALAHYLAGAPAARLYLGVFPQTPHIAWLTQPLLVLPEHTAYYVYSIANLLGLALGAYWTLVTWPWRTRVLAAALLTIAPPGVRALSYGTDTWLVAIALGLAWRGRQLNQPRLAGAAAVLALSKPYLALPIILVFCWSAPAGWRWPAARSFALCSVLWVAFAPLCTRNLGIYGGWLRTVRQLTRADQAEQANLLGLFEHVTTFSQAQVLAVLCLPLTAPLLYFLLGDPRIPHGRWQPSCLAALAVAWIVTPFNHVTESLLLVPPLLACAFPTGSLGLPPPRAIQGVLWLYVVGNMAIYLSPIDPYNFTIVLPLAMLIVMIPYCRERNRTSAADGASAAGDQTGFPARKACGGISRRIAARN